MGVDAYFVIRFKEEPTKEQIKHLRYHLLHRFKRVLHWHNDEQLLDVITPSGDALGDYGEIENDGKLYDIDTMQRYYGEGYERGPGLEIATMLLYLNRQPEIANVYYGGDGRLEEYKEKDAQALLDYWLKEGELPYRLGWATKKIVLCDWCDMPMANNGGCGNIDYWYCEGCEQRKELPC